MQAGIPVTGVKESGKGKGFPETILADAVVAVKKPVVAEKAVVMDALHHRDIQRFTDIIRCRGN